MARSESSIKSRLAHYIRSAGSDLRRGDLAVSAGTLSAQPMSACWRASTPHGSPSIQGRESASFRPETSSRAATAPLELGQIRDSNRQGLLAALQRDGFVGVDLGVLRDDEEVISAAIREGVERCDAPADLRRGVHGQFDFVKVVLEALGGRGRAERSTSSRWRSNPRSLVFRRRRRQAGGRAGVRSPGNPVSSMVSYQVVALPGLQKARRSSFAATPPASRRRGR